MSLRALPTIAVPVILYNMLIVFAGGGSAASFLQVHVVHDEDDQGCRVGVLARRSDHLITMIFLFVELIKATYTSAASLVDHGLSMLVFIICIIEFLVVDAAATSVFFFVMVGALIDVVAGFTIGIRVARRDLTIGAGS